MRCGGGEPIRPGRRLDTKAETVERDSVMKLTDWLGFLFVMAAIAMLFAR